MTGHKSSNPLGLGELLPHQPTTPNGGFTQWKIILQDGDTMRTGHDGTQIIGPMDSNTVIEKIENGEIDTDSSLIALCPRGRNAFHP